MVMPTSPSDAALVRYVLGFADREDEEQFDELSVTDAAFAERLRAIEHDLADAYARGELSPTDRERWETRYLASQHGRDDLALARALADRELEGHRLDSRGRGSEDRAFATRGFRLGALWALAAGVVMVAVIGGYRLARRDAPSARVAQTQTPSTPSSAAAPAQSAPVADVIALTLSPAVRSIDQPPTLAIPPGTGTVALTLKLQPDAHDRYTVAVQDLSTNIRVWSSSDAVPAGAGPDRSLVVTIPASLFRTRRYLISVSAEPEGRDTIATYTVIVVRE
jgi:hypothetical protein